MATAVRTSVTELPESRVRVDAEVPADEVERRVQEKAKALGRQLRIPGFRKGKVPAPLVIQRIGRDTVLDETIRDTLGRWYSDAIDAAGIDPVGDPKLDLGDPPGEGQALTFTIEIGVRPTARLGDYRGLEVGRREPEVDDEAVEREVGALRERLARLETVERPADKGDYVVIDYVGSIDGEQFAGGEGRDQLVELAAGRLIPGFEDGLVGATAGQDIALDVTFPEDYGNAELAGRPATFAVTVKEVKRKELPELDDDFAADVGFDSVDEMREDIRGRLRDQDGQRIEAEFREAALDAAAEKATIDVPEPLVQARAQELWERTLHSLSHQGVTRETYLQVTGRSEEEILREAAPEAEQALRREAVIAAVIEAEGIEPSDEDVLEALGPIAEREGTTAEKLLEDVRGSGRLDALRRDLAARHAVDLLTAEAKPIPADQAAARERLWTPEKDSDAAHPTGGGQLWTPGQ
jgi:trigger factor